jgi:hypothetical protein
MAYIIVCVILYVILGLLLWSLCAINKGSLVESKDGMERAGIKKVARGIPLVNERKLDTGCQVYIIQSLYSKDFILPGDVGLKYKFRIPLPSIDEG